MTYPKQANRFYGHVNLALILFNDSHLLSFFPCFEFKMDKKKDKPSERRWNAAYLSSSLNLPPSQLLARPHSSLSLPQHHQLKSRFLKIILHDGEKVLNLFFWVTDPVNKQHRSFQKRIHSHSKWLSTYPGAFDYMKLYPGPWTAGDKPLLEWMHKVSEVTSQDWWQALQKGFCQALSPRPPTHLSFPKTVK